MKLVAAKCPNCGANIEVDENSDKTRCNYCNTQIIVEDAIQKYQIDISGKVNVEGILGKNDLLDQAKKHMKLEEYNEAETILRQIISSQDRFDIEVYGYLLRTLVKNFEKQQELNEQDNSGLQDFFGFGEEFMIKPFDETAGRYGEYDDFEYEHSQFAKVDEISDIYVRAKKIDEKNELDNLLGNELSKVIHFYKISEQLKKDEKTILSAEEKFKKVDEDFLFKFAKDEYFRQNEQLIKEKMYQLIKDDLKICDGFKFRYDEIFKSRAEYQFAYITMIQRDGSILTTYNKTNATNTNAKYSIENYYASKEKPNSIDEVIQRIEKLTEDYTYLYNNPKNVISTNKKGLFSKLFNK